MSGKNYDKILEELQGLAREEFMLQCYTNLVLHPELLNAEQKHTQINVLEMMIDFFQDREEFEKCADLLKLLKKVRKKK